MTALTRFDPRKDLMPDSMPEFVRSFMRMADWPVRAAADDMKLDVSENDKEYLIKAEIPGARKEDISISVDGNYVTLSAEVKEEKKETRKHNGERTLLQEMRYGNVTRGFTLPHDVDDKSADAKYENGVLSLTLPKRAPTTSKAITIK